MTTREFLTVVVNANISDETTAKANELIAALDKRNAQRKGKPTKANAESAERRKAVADFLASRPTEVFNREQIAEELGLTGYAAGLLPQDKVAYVERLLAEMNSSGNRKLTFIGRYKECKLCVSFCCKCIDLFNKCREFFDILSANFEC